jgi:RNA polymerase sigma-70 factor (ECF subfamily)
MRAARRGDEARVRVLVRDLHPRLLRYLRARDPLNADDIAHAAWVEVASRLDELEDDAGELARRLFTTAAQLVAERRAASAAPRADRSTHVTGNRHRTSNDVTALDDGQGQGAVDLIVATLDEDQSEVVLLRTLGGLSDAAIGAMMQRPTAWVGSTHDRALRTLRATLGTP